MGDGNGRNACSEGSLPSVSVPGCCLLPAILFFAVKKGAAFRAAPRSLSDSASAHRARRVARAGLRLFNASIFLPRPSTLDESERSSLRVGTFRL